MRWLTVEKTLDGSWERAHCQAAVAGAHSNPTGYGTHHSTVHRRRGQRG